MQGDSGEAADIVEMRLVLSAKHRKQKNTGKRGGSLVARGGERMRRKQGVDEGKRDGMKLDLHWLLYLGLAGTGKNKIVFIEFESDSMMRFDLNAGC